MRANPRFMVRDYPPEITAHLPPRTAQEKKGALRYGLPFLLMLVFFPLGCGLLAKFTRQVDFFQVWLQVLILLSSFNLFDLIILDWLIFCTITPPFMVLPGSEGHPGYKNYHFHFIGFLKGLLLVLLASLSFAGLIEALAALVSALGG